MKGMAVRRVMWVGGARVFAFSVLALVVVGSIGVLWATPAHAKTFTVNSTADNGVGDQSPEGTCDLDSGAAVVCTLREAIQESNFVSGADTIAFAIPSSDTNCAVNTHVCTITPVFIGLPLITKRVTIDGYTQSEASPNTLTQPDKTNAVLKIELAGPRAGLNLVGASNSVIRGLAIGGCTCGYGLFMIGGTGYKVEGNFIGTDASGTVNRGSGANGVSLQSGTSGSMSSYTSNSTIGGTDASDGTVDGVVEARNLISGNTQHGVVIPGGSHNTIEGNLIGTDKDGNPLPNGGSGVRILGSSAGNRILSNSIFSNVGLGIDLIGPSENNATNVPTPNDTKDPDTGANRLQNYPDITSAQFLGGFTSINGTLNSTPSTRKKKRIFIIQFFSSPAADSPSGYGEGKTFLGQIQVKTNRQGNVSPSPFTFGIDENLSDQVVTATATNKATGDTSEFSEAKPVQSIVIGP